MPKQRFFSALSFLPALLCAGLPTAHSDRPRRAGLQSLVPPTGGLQTATEKPARSETGAEQQILNLASRSRLTGDRDSAVESSGLTYP